MGAVSMAGYPHTAQQNRGNQHDKEPEGGQHGVRDGPKSDARCLFSNAHMCWSHGSTGRVVPSEGDRGVRQVTLACVWFSGDWYDYKPTSLSPDRITTLLCHSVSARYAESAGRLLSDSSRDAVVEFYRCDDCKQVWSHRKFERDSEPNLVTVVREMPDAGSK